MLKITVSEEGATRRMKLEGKLAGALVVEAEHAWRSFPRDQKAVEVDLKGVTCMDEGGKQLLGEMRKAGAQFQACGVAMKAILAELGGKLAGVSIALVLLAFSGDALKAQTPATVKLTLKDAVGIALKQNPQVAIANLNLVQSQEQSKVVRSAILPQASLALSDRVTRGNVEALLGDKIPNFPGHIGPFWTITAGPEFSVPLFDLAAWRRWQAARESIKTADAARTTVREMNAQLVVSQYLGGLRAAAEVKASQSRKDLAKALFDLATDLQKSGVGTGIDTLRANVQYQNERQRLSEASTRLKTSLYGLARLLNLPAEQQVELADEPSFFETPEFQSDNSVARAYEQRPEIRSILAQIRTAELQKQAIKGERVPKLTAGGNWTLQGVTPSSMIPAYQIGAQVEVPLITGGRIKAETAVADIEIKKLAQSQQEIRNQVALEVKTAIAQLESARVEVDAANLGVTLSKEGVTQAQDRFKAGVANNIEVITAQDELSRANDNQIAALYRYNQSRADLARATGQMEALYAN